MAFRISVTFSSQCLAFCQKNYEDFDVFTKGNIPRLLESVSLLMPGNNLTMCWKKVWQGWLWQCLYALSVKLYIKYMLRRDMSLKTSQGLCTAVMCSLEHSMQASAVRLENKMHRGTSSYFHSAPLICLLQTASRRRMHHKKCTILFPGYVSSLHTPLPASSYFRHWLSFPLTARKQLLC